MFPVAAKIILEGTSPLLVTGLGQSRDREARLAQLRTCRVLLLGDEIMVTPRKHFFVFLWITVNLCDMDLEPETNT